MAKTYTIEEKQEAIIEYNKSGTTISVSDKIESMKNENIVKLIISLIQLHI